MQLRAGIEVSDEALAGLCHRYGVQELALFGSSARGDFHPDSDLDVLVEFEPSTEVGLIEFAGLREDLEALLGVRVDLVSKRGLNRRIRDAVLSEARRLYAA